MNKFIIFLIFLTSLSAAAVDSSCYQKRKIVLFFGNGMFNLVADAKESAKELGLLVQNDPSISKEHLENSNKVEVAYNTNEVALMQILQVLSQKSDSEVANFLIYLRKLNIAPKWFQDFISKTVAQHFKEEQIKDSDLRDQVATYQQALDRKATPVVVSHSQGNLYANMAYTQLKEPMDGTPRLRIISIATPASYVAGDGPHVTLKSDGVIKYIPHHLEENTEMEPAGYFDHEFIGHYLKGDDSREMIVEYLKSALEQPVPINDKYSIGQLNADLQPLWFRLINKSVEQIKLTKAECLLYHTITDFLDAYSEPCTTKNKSLVARAINDCQNDRSIKENGTTYCPYGGGAYLRRYSRVFEADHPECDLWYLGAIEDFSASDYDDARKILKEN